MVSAVLPLFHLYGDPPDDQAFDFIHIETVASRSSLHDWIIGTHRHRNLFQILLIERGGGTMAFEAANIAFEAPCAILVPATIAHGFRFRPIATDGWVMTFTEDVAEAMGDRRREALARLKALAAAPVVPVNEAVRERLSKMAAELHDECFLARAGFRIAMRGLLALIAVEVARLAAGRARFGEEQIQFEPAEATVEALRKLVEEHFRKERQLAFYADRLVMTVDRLNDHVKRAAGVTAGHLLRQRILTEAKRQLVFTGQSIHEIAGDLAFSDPSHFARFFRKHTGRTPHEFEWRRRSMIGSVCEFESYIHRSGCTVPYPTLRTRRSCFTAASALPRHNRTKTGRTGPKKGMLIKFRLTGRFSLDSYFFNRLDRNSRRKERQGEAQIVHLFGSDSSKSVKPIQ